METKPYTIVIGGFNGQIGKRTNPMESSTGKFGFELKNEGGDTLVEWANKYKIMYTMTKRPPEIDAAQIGSRKIEIKLKLRNRFETV